NSSLQHESSHVRLEALNVIIAALLRHENTQINFDELLGHISSILQDPSVKVRKVALDLCAVIQHRIGRGNMSLFLNSLSAPLKQQVEERLDQPGLPKVLPNGLIDYTNQQNKRVALPINAPSLTPQSKLNVNPANIPQILHKTTSHNIPDSKMNEKNGLSNMGISGSKLYTPANIYIGKTVQNQELITLSSPSASSPSQPSESINESNNASEAGSQSFTSGSLTPQKEQFSQRLKQRPSLIGIVGKP
ncbi:MAG: hypothetical protein EZS28_046944, partial [Streblomastix strix]